MNPQQIFGLQVLLSFLVYGLVARWYVTPRLASRAFARPVTDVKQSRR